MYGRIYHVLEWTQFHKEANCPKLVYTFNVEKIKSQPRFSRKLASLYKNLYNEAKKNLK